MKHIKHLSKTQEVQQAIAAVPLKPGKGLGGPQNSEIIIERL